MSRDEVYIRHILDAIAKIERYVAVGQEQFFAEPLWQDAVIRQLEIVGEATKRISRDVRNRYPDVEWRRMAGMRDVLAHNYMAVDLRVVWRVTQQSLPELKRQLEAILADERTRGDDAAEQ